MMGTHPHHPMAVPIVGKDPRQALIAIIAPETTRKGITSISILKFIRITIMLLMMNINHGIKKHVAFVVYITMCLLSARRE